MKLKALGLRIETVVAGLALGGVMLLPLAEIASRQLFHRGIPGSGSYAQSLLLWVGLIGAAIAARDGKLLTLATGEYLPKGTVSRVAHVFSGIVGSAIATVLALGAIDLVHLDRESGDLTASIPVWIFDLALPIGFGLVAVRLVLKAASGWTSRAVAALGLILGVWIHGHAAGFGAHPLWPWLTLVIASALLGAPIFTLLGGIALFSKLAAGGKPVVLLIKAYEQLTTNTGLAAIPLFTFAGFLLAEGKSSERLLRLLRAWFGWAPGGAAIAAAALCAFFTLFTGGSGVTILVLGGLLLPTLIAEGYRERFSIGLLTASGSLGLLFPLSLPLMLYSIVTQRPEADIESLFIGGLIPGLLMLGLMAAMGMREGVAAGAARTPFRTSEAFGSIWEAKWELLLPVFVLGMFVSGKATLVQTAPLAALYTLVVQRFVHRDLPTIGDILRVLNDCAALVGGVLIILAVAAGLTDYFVDARVSERLAEWTQLHVHSRIVFLLGLNVFLLLVGTVMDIFSAIIVVVPLLLGLADAFQINLVHLGIIFVANLELGFLHPPLGLNLLLASIRFKKPVLEVTWATLPMLGILAVGVLLITYFSWLTLGLLHWMGKG